MVILLKWEGHFFIRLFSSSGSDVDHMKQYSEVQWINAFYFLFLINWNNKWTSNISYSQLQQKYLHLSCECENWQFPLSEQLCIYELYFVSKNDYSQLTINCSYLTLHLSQYPLICFQMLRGIFHIWLSLPTKTLHHHPLWGTSDDPEHLQFATVVTLKVYNLYIYQDKKQHVIFI